MQASTMAKDVCKNWPGSMAENESIVIIHKKRVGIKECEEKDLQKHL